MSKDPKDDCNDKEIELRPSDFMLSMLLKDFLSADEPPDFKSRILAELESAKSKKNQQSILPLARTSICTDVEYDEAVNAASKDIEGGYGASDAKPVLMARPTDEDRTVWIRGLTIMAGVLAASVLGAIFVPSAYRTWRSKDRQADVVENALKPDSKSATSVNAEPISIEKLDSAVEQLTYAPPKPEIIRKQVDAPESKAESTLAHVDKPRNVGSESDVASLPRASVAGKIIGNAEIIGVIDDQLSYLWSRVGLTPLPIVQNDVWLDRAAVAIVGRLATAAEKEVFRTSKNQDRIFEYVDNLISSSEFPKYWSKKLAEHYLGKRIPSTRNQPMSEGIFVAWLEESLTEKVFVGDLERIMIDGPTPSLGGPTIRTDPAAFWLSEILDHATVNHKNSVEQLSPPVKRRQPREDALIGVSRQLMRIGGNPSMVCSQCHVDEALSSDMQGYAAMSTTQSEGGSDSFWSVPANLSGISLVYESGNRKLRVEPRSDFFFEDVEGRMKLAVPGLPSPRKNENANQSLAEWFSSSTEPRLALVEMVWGEILQQPMVPAIGLSEDEGLSERVDLRELLASQIQLQKADLGSLIRWIALSKVFRLEGLKTDAPWYLKATESQIAESQRQLRLFAGFPALVALNGESGKLPIGRVASWIDKDKTFQKADVATLAQGSSSKVSGNVAKPLKLDYSEAQVRYLVSVREPYSQLKGLSKRWANSSMSWQMLLEHAYLATDSRFPTKSEREEANKLLETFGRDREQTLVRIVNARLGSW